MKIVNFEEFLDFAGEMQTRYKFYRIAGLQPYQKLQCFMVGRESLIIHSETENTKQNLQVILGKDFIQTELTPEEIRGFGLK